MEMSKVQNNEKVYRAVVGGLLPEGFLVENDHGVRGGVDFASMSTTTDREVANTYAEGSGGGRVATICEIKLGIVDRGADLSHFSRYPHENLNPY